MVDFIKPLENSHGEVKCSEIGDTNLVGLESENTHQVVFHTAEMHLVYVVDKNGRAVDHRLGEQFDVSNVVTDEEKVFKEVAQLMRATFPQTLTNPHYTDITVVMNRLPLLANYLSKTSLSKTRK